jgi:GNAT superfamily N-acetyltransferase
MSASGQKHPHYYGANPPAYYGDYTIGLEKMTDVLLEFSRVHCEELEETEPRWLTFPIRANYRMYMQAELASKMVMFTLRHKDVPVGSLLYFLKQSPNVAGAMMASDAGLYITPEHRKGRLGIRLMDYAEDTLKALGIHYIVHSDKSPAGGMNLGKLFNRQGYKPFAVSYVKEINELESKS